MVTRNVRGLRDYVVKQRAVRSNEILHLRHRLDLAFKMYDDILERILYELGKFESYSAAPDEVGWEGEQSPIEESNGAEVVAEVQQ